MKEDLIIDGCAFTETEFTGVTEDVLHSKMDAFFLTIPGEGNGPEACCPSGAGSLTPPWGKSLSPPAPGTAWGPRGLLTESGGPFPPSPDLQDSHS